MQPKSLFEQLQAQKEKAQQEHDEKYDISKKQLFDSVFKSILIAYQPVIYLVNPIPACWWLLKSE